MNFKKTLFAAVLLMLSKPGLAETVEATLTIKDHRFSPAEISVPAGSKVKLTIDNQDATPEEFESHDLNREKVIPGRSKAIIWIGPLKQGSYAFVGEYHESTAKGRIIVK